MVILCPFDFCYHEQSRNYLRYYGDFVNDLGDLGCRKSFNFVRFSAELYAEMAVLVELVFRMGLHYIRRGMAGLQNKSTSLLT